MSAIWIIICTISLTLNAIVLLLTGASQLDTFVRAGRLSAALWQARSLTKRNAAQQEMLENSHRNNERLRAEVTALTRGKVKP